MSRESTSITPELALVDPKLGEWARERLPAPPDTLEALRFAQARPAPEAARAGQRTRRWRRRFVTAAGLLVVLAGTAFLVGSRADVDEQPASPPPAIAEPQPPAAAPPAAKPANEPAARTRPARRSVGVARARRFAWPPVAGASGYHVELFKGSTLVFRSNTKKPQILIRRRWRFNGRRRSLEQGAYRWYVWPLVGGRRKAKAIVQAKLVVPA